MPFKDAEIIAKYSEVCSANNFFKLFSHVCPDDEVNDEFSTDEFSEDELKIRLKIQHAPVPIARQKTFIPGGSKPETTPMIKRPAAYVQEIEVMI